MTDMANGFWNGQDAQLRSCVVEIADSGRFPEYWAKDLVGKARIALEVRPHENEFKGNRIRTTRTMKLGNPFYLDDQDGSAWAKCTQGRGSPGYPSRELEIEKIIEILPDPVEQAPAS